MKFVSNTFILGAGASAAYGFPMGRDLKAEAVSSLIANNSSARAVINQVGMRRQFTPADVSYFVESLSRDNRNLSIDAFIESRKEDDRISQLEEIARSVIAMLIMSHEDPLKLDPPENWYKLLFEKMFEGNNTAETFFENKVNFVTFNYDRSFEAYFLREVCDAFQLSMDDAREKLLASFPIIHVHGSLGSLWDEEREYKTDGQEDVVQIDAAADSIKLITDDVSTQGDAFIKAQSLIRDATTVHFIGNGYHTKNMERLGFTNIQELNPREDKFFGTAQGLNSRDFLLNRRLYRIDVTQGNNADNYSLVGDALGMSASSYIDCAPFD